MSRQNRKLGASFRWFNATQFLGALNDNVFRWLIIFFLIGLYGRDKASSLTALVGAVFVVPFLLFTAFAGKLADGFSKRNIIVAAKIAELVVMVAACVAFMLESSVGVLVVLFLMCTQSAFFGPSKYGIVPELVKSEELSRANGFLEGLTYSAVVVGTAVAPFLAQVSKERYGLAAAACVGIALAGVIASLSIKHTAAVGAKKKASVFFVKDIWRTLQGIGGDKELLLVVLASAYFMLLGGFIQMNMIPYGIEALKFSGVQSGYLFLVAAIGIGAGSLAAGALSRRGVELGIVPIGMTGMAVCSIVLGLIGRAEYKYPVFAAIFLMGASAGLFVVPIHAFIQLRSRSEIRGEVVAASGFLGWIGVLMSAGMLYVFSQILNMSAAQTFLILGVFTAVPAAITAVVFPDFLVRLIILLLTRLCYRIKVVGAENVPAEGGVLIVSNHVSWADAVILGVSLQRHIRFVMDREIYNYKWLKPFCKLMRVIPVSMTDPPKRIVASLRQARAAMEAGDVVCIFAEGAVTRTGLLGQFKSGFEKIVRQTDYMIIPAYIGGAWGSIFSHYHGRLLSTLPRKVPYPVSVHFGEPMGADSTANEIRQKVMELSCDYFDSRKSKRRSLGDHFVRSARKNWRRLCMSDTTGKNLSYAQALTASIALGTEINKLTCGQDKVGIILPPSTAGALANIAVTILGKVSVNLSYVTSNRRRAAAVERCGLKCIISSRKFIEKIPDIGDLPGLVFLEDIAEQITRPDKIKAYLKARFAEPRILTKAKGFCADDLATVIFSSGSTGDPKGIMLSHHNIISNIEAIRMVFKIHRHDNLCGVLPFFHSLGYTGTIWLPMFCGVSVGYVADPLDGREVAKSVRRNKSTLLFAPPTFFVSYIRRAERTDFASLRKVLAGAEKLKADLADAFEAKFGIGPLEGYGATELSPVAALNLPDVEIGGVRQVAGKRGTVGHPIPGVAVKIVEPETLEPLAVGESGLLLVKGPNVMLGYLGMEKATREVIKDGWYNTGDIASIDEDGFLTITDRLSRFSKIAGEMVPHIAVEEVCMRGLRTGEQVVAVTSVPEDKKGEELVVLYLEKAGGADKLYEIVAKSDLPNISKPRRDNYIQIESMPVLGSGKIDLVRLRKMAIAAKGRGAGNQDSS